MTTVETSRICCGCKRVFCCAQCRERHEKKKHALRQPNCPLCISQKLPLKGFDDKALLDHIANAHLPLHCSLCGEIFKESKDLESFGTCKWWNCWNHHFRAPEKKSILGTPPLDSEGKVLAEYKGNFHALTSPPELLRTTSTPMVLGQKSNFKFTTPIAPNFSLKTPKTNSASMNKIQTSKMKQDSDSPCTESSMKYHNVSGNIDHGQTPCRNLPAENEAKEELSRSSFRKLDATKDETDIKQSDHCADNNSVEDMELTNIEANVLPDSQNLEVHQLDKRSESMKRVRFTDEYMSSPEHGSPSNLNATENEEFFEAYDTFSGLGPSFEQSQMKIYEENARNTEKENCTPDKYGTSRPRQSAGSSRVMMMVLVESDSAVPTSDLIDSGLKKLERMSPSVQFSMDTPSCSSSMTSMDSYHSIPNQNSVLREFSNSANRISNKLDNSSVPNSNNSHGGILSAFANVVRNVIRRFPGVGSSRNIEREQMSSRMNTIPGPPTSQNFSSVSSISSSMLQRPGKRPREAIESPPTSRRHPDLVAPHTEIRSPLPKRQRGWYKIKGREPIARMRGNRHITSPRGVSSETQVFHQGSLSVRDTVLPLPDRAHQSTQTDEA